MTTESAPRVKTAFCRYCLKPRHPEEMCVIRSASGQPRRRCIHCMPPAPKAAAPTTPATC